MRRLASGNSLSTVCEIRCPNRLFVGDFCRLGEQVRGGIMTGRDRRTGGVQQKSAIVHGAGKVGADRGAKNAVLTG